MSQSSTQPNQNSQSSTLSNQEMQELISLRREKAALSQILWNLVTMAAPDTHKIEVSPAPTDPLWQLAFVRSSDQESGKVCLLAGTIPEITEQEKKRVVRLLRGTTKPMHEALAELKIPHPSAYVEDKIKAHLVWKEHTDSNGGFWESIKPPSIGERAKNFLHMRN